MKRFAVIGNPIVHSLSPCMHRANFLALGIEASYELKQVLNLEKEMKDLKQLDGFNVTLPYKQMIIPFLDDVDPIAKAIGAVNTVKNVNGKLMGYNTDVDGFFESFQGLNVKLDASILILGAGGAARAVYFALIKNGYQNITIANRTLDKAKDICDNSISLVQAGEQLESYQCIINTTSVGLIEGQCPIDLKNLNSNHVVMDLIYKPKLTTLLKRAKELNCRYEFGLDMLLIQGAKAFEIWFNQEANRTMMKQQLEVELYVNR
ncbi:shikimate dehydrogenase [Turicibacter sanguinis]|uniref:shikimate dehydrogenase n=1 Tax=Turicibacter sanguinis TaxID=154288 RepID=UPI0032EAF140